ncbi:Uncharacterised protein [Streptococcus suis]|uniref:hypothetical protein n=1 Tax=Streptococcus suis TaxID=1307 RepID=UPI0005CF0000|nr:hypothetical protein [Streptococcus suis]CYU46191.1 Uncharacterised protein [Streptococcus suis]
MEKEKTMTNPLQEHKTVEVGYAIIGISQDEEEVLIVDYDSNWVDEEEFLHRSLITNYQDERSSYQQIMDWLQATIPHTAYNLDQLEAVDFNQEMKEEINRELARHNQALLVRSIECIDGTHDLLAIAYDPAREQEEELQYYLKHHVEALYMGRVVQLYQVPIQDAYEQADLSEFLLEATPSFMDRALLVEDESTILSELHKLGFVSIHELDIGRLQKEAQQMDQEQERGL